MSFRRFGGILEGVMLAFLGLYMLWLVDSEHYWKYLNPKFWWITTAGACGLLIAGLAVLAPPGKSPRKIRSFLFAAFIGLIVYEHTAGNGSIWEKKLDASNRRETLQVVPGLEKTEAMFIIPSSCATGGILVLPSLGEMDIPRIQLGEEDYAIASVAELYLMDASVEKTEVPRQVMTLGMVKRNPELDNQGQIALVRVSVVCCMADAVAVGFRVKVPNVEDFVDGEWMRVQGHFENMREGEKRLRIKVEGVFNSGLSNRLLLIPENVEHVGEPDIPYYFSW